jgi:multisubunit Na+/H+ antiporter MnhB subunit
MSAEDTIARSTSTRENGFGIGRCLLLAAVLATVMGIGWALWSLPPQSAGLGRAVLVELKSSGVNNSVTAVLLNFRGYDTLLEMCVLLLAVLGTWTLGSVSARTRRSPPGPILKASASFLVPVTLTVAGYLLWAGKDAPGGAFQAGAVLSAAGVILLLLDTPVPDALVGWPLRAALVIGILVFLGVAVGAMLAGGRLLEYPRDLAGDLIVLIEAAATVSIAVTLTTLFAGGRLEGGDVSHGEPSSVEPHDGEALS